MFKKNKKYNKKISGSYLKRIIGSYDKKYLLALLLALGVAAASCEKDDTIDKIEPTPVVDPNIAKIKALSTDSTALHKKIPEAVDSAKHYDSNISNYFNGLFGRGEVILCDGHDAKNIGDSLKVLKYVDEQARIELGDPLPINKQTMNSLANYRGKFNNVLEELASLRASKTK